MALVYTIENAVYHILPICYRCRFRGRRKLTLVENQVQRSVTVIENQSHIILHPARHHSGRKPVYHCSQELDIESKQRLQQAIFPEGITMTREGELIAKPTPLSQINALLKRSSRRDEGSETKATCNTIGNTLIVSNNNKIQNLEKIMYQWKKIDHFQDLQHQILLILLQIAVVVISIVMPGAPGTVRTCDLRFRMSKTAQSAQPPLYAVSVHG